MIVIVYVNDILAFATQYNGLSDFQVSLVNEYEVNHFLNVNYSIGMEL